MYSIAYSVRVSNFIPKKDKSSLFIFSIISVIFINVLSLLVMQDFFHTHVYLFAFASIFVPSIYVWLRSTLSFSKITLFIPTKISSIELVKSSLIKFPTVTKDGAFISSKSHIYLMSVLQDFSIPRNDKYPFSINENNIILSKFVRLYLGRPVL